MKKIHISFFYGGIMGLTDFEDRVVQRAFAVSLASERFNRYELYRGKQDFEEKESLKRFKTLKRMIEELKVYCKSV
jgi:hypothetical protein